MRTFLIFAWLLILTACAEHHEPNQSKAVPSICQNQDGFVWGESVTWDDDTGPEAREHAVLLADMVRNRLILTSGTGYKPQPSDIHDAWAFNIGTRTWRRLELSGELPGGGSRRATPFDDKGISIIFGGYDRNQVPQSDLFKLQVSDEALTISRLEQVNRPPPHMLHGFVHDAQADRYYLFGGVKLDGEASYGFSETLWSMRLVDGVAYWSEVPTDSVLPPRYGFPYFFEETHGRIHLWGGANSEFPKDQPEDIWVFDVRSERAQWLQVDAGNSVARPTARRNPQFAYEAGSRQLIIWGGTSDGKTSTPDSSALRFDTAGLRWIPIPKGPEGRASGMAVAVPGKSTTWLGFGNTATRFQDLTPLSYCGRG